MFNPYPNLPFQIKDYILTSIIGIGGFAVVYKATHVKFNAEFALKVVGKSAIPGKNAATYNTEINSLSKLDHPNVIKLYDFFIDNGNMILVLEYCQGGTLESRISMDEIISDEDKISICIQIISALKYCYDMSLTHQDIKAGNILFDSKGRVKIADFGLSEFIHHDNSSNQHLGTLHYLAPEVCQKGLFNPFKSDIWSIGVLFYRLFTYTYPFEGNDKVELKDAIIRGFYNERLTGQMLLPIRKMFLINPENRITINKLSKMDMFTIPLRSPTYSHLPQLKMPLGSSLNVKLNKKKSSLIYNQKLSQNKKIRNYSSQRATLIPLTFS